MILLRTPYSKRLIQTLLKPKFYSSSHSPAVHHQCTHHIKQEHDQHQQHDHGHGHHAAPYDWRDDFTKNPDYEQDILHRGVPHPKDYHFPHEAPHVTRPSSHPAQYNPKDLRYNLVNVKRVMPISNTLRAPQTNLQGDIAHQFDYESQDLDFQAQNFHSQHFRKKGNMWMWLTVGLMPFIFVSCEFFLQKYPDQDHWRYQRPPPLCFPDEDDTPDRDTYKLFKSGEFRRLYEAGIMVPPFFEIVDGKKVYTKWSGVNQPMEVF